LFGYLVINQKSIYFLSLGNRKSGTVFFRKVFPGTIPYWPVFLPRGLQVIGKNGFDPIGSVKAGFSLAKTFRFGFCQVLAGIIKNHPEKLPIRPVKADKTCSSKPPLDPDWSMSRMFIDRMSQFIPGFGPGESLGRFSMFQQNTGLSANLSLMIISWSRFAVTQA